MKPFKDALDNLVPLDEGSFANVVDLGIDIPLRFAECYALLDDGRRVRLKDRRQLLGWSGNQHRRSYYFRSGGTIVCVRTNTSHRAPVRMVELWDDRQTVTAFSSRDSRVKNLGLPAHRITTVDGSLLYVASSPSRSLTPAAKARAAQPIRPIPNLADAHAS